MKIITQYFKQLNKIPVKIHWSLYLFLLFVLFTSDIFNTLTLLAVYGFVFLHEHGHIFAAKKYNVSCNHILMSPLGGIAYLNARGLTNKQDLIVSFAGPLINLICSLLLATLFFLYTFFGANSELFLTTTFTLAKINLVLFLFNLIPAYPLDGGNILKSLLMMSNKYRYDAVKITSIVGKAFAVLFVIAAFYTRNPMLGLVALFVWFGSDKNGQHN